PTGPDNPRTPGPPAEARTYFCQLSFTSGVLRRARNAHHPRHRTKARQFVQHEKQSLEPFPFRKYSQEPEATHGTARPVRLFLEPGQTIVNHRQFSGWVAGAQTRGAYGAGNTHDLAQPVASARAHQYPPGRVNGASLRMIVQRPQSRASGQAAHDRGQFPIPRRPSMNNVEGKITPAFEYAPGLQRKFPGRE